MTNVVDLIKRLFSIFLEQSKELYLIKSLLTIHINDLADMNNTSHFN